MKIDFKGLLEGIWNSVFTKEVIEETAEERLEICRDCPFNSKKSSNSGIIRMDEHCTDCGCNLHWKTRCLSCECPQKKWLAVISEEEEKKIDEKLKSDNNT